MLPPAGFSERKNIEAWYRDYGRVADDFATKQDGLSWHKGHFQRHYPDFWPGDLNATGFAHYLNYSAFRVHGNDTKPWQASGNSIGLKQKKDSLRKPSKMRREEVLKVADKFHYDTSSGKLCVSVKKSEVTQWPQKLDPKQFCDQLNQQVSQRNIESAPFQPDPSGKVMLVWLSESWCSILEQQQLSLGSFLRKQKGNTSLVIASPSASTEIDDISIDSPSSTSSARTLRAPSISVPASHSDKVLVLSQLVLKMLMSVCLQHFANTRPKTLFDKNKQGIWRCVHESSLVPADLLEGEEKFWIRSKQVASKLKWPIFMRFTNCNAPPDEVPLDPALVKTFDIAGLLWYVKKHCMLLNSLQETAWELFHEVRHLFPVHPEGKQLQLLEEVIKITHDMHGIFQRDGYAKCNHYKAAYEGFLREKGADNGSVEVSEGVKLEGYASVVLINFGMNFHTRLVRSSLATHGPAFKNAFSGGKQEEPTLKGFRTWRDDWFLHKKVDFWSRSCHIFDDADRLIKVRDNLIHGDWAVLRVFEEPNTTVRFIFDSIRTLHDALEQQGLHVEQPDQILFDQIHQLL